MKFSEKENMPKTYNFTKFRSTKIKRSSLNKDAKIQILTTYAGLMKFLE